MALPKEQLPLKKSGAEIQPQSPEKAPKRRNRKKFYIPMVAASTLALGGALVIDNSKGDADKPIVTPETTTFTGVPVPTVNNPVDTTVNIPSTIPETVPQTSIPERTFTSPEQKLEVEAVEANMREFFKMTPEDVKNFFKTTRFEQNPSTGNGFGILHNFPDFPEDKSFLEAGINLGYFTVPMGTGSVTLGAFGFYSPSVDEATHIVGLRILNMDDPQIEALSIYMTTNPSLPLFKPLADSGNLKVFDLQAVRGELYTTLNSREAFFELINSSIGRVFAMEYMTNIDSFAKGFQLQLDTEHLIENGIQWDKAFSVNSKSLDAFIKNPENRIYYGEVKPAFSQDLLNGFTSVAEALESVPAVYLRFFPDMPPATTL